jgi:hypothetical protein
MPWYTPLIGRFQLAGKVLRRVATIPIRQANGTPASGRPNPAGVGGTGEVPVDISGASLPFDPWGIDSEGLVVANGGTFWLADEYGPHIMHIGTDGRIMERVSPFGPGRTLPAVLAARRANRGLEGLAMLRGGRVLVGAMQSPLDNPRAAGRVSRLTRLLWFDTRTGETRQYVYVLGSASLLISEITAVSRNTLLTLERDSAFPGAGSTVKRIYRIHLSGATDISDPANGAQGRLFGGKTLEQLSVAELATWGITPVSRHWWLTCWRSATRDKPGPGRDRPAHHRHPNDDWRDRQRWAGWLPRPCPCSSGVVDYNTVWFVTLPKPACLLSGGSSRARRARPPLEGRSAWPRASVAFYRPTAA